MVQSFGGRPVKRRVNGVWVEVGTGAPVTPGYPPDYFPDYGDTGADVTRPVVAITAPASGASVTGTVTVSGTVSDNIAVASVVVRANGVTLGTATRSGTTWTYSWNTAASGAGSQTLTAQASDTSGNTATSAARTVTVTVPAVGPPPAPSGSFGDANGSLTAGYTGPIPASAVNFTGTTGAAFKAAIQALPANGWLKVSSPTIVGNFTLSGTNIPSGVTICNAPGVRPVIRDSVVDMSDGVGWRWFGIDITYPAPDPGVHMVKFDGGSGWEVAYSRFYGTRCFTLVRVGQEATNWRVHHCQVYDNQLANAANQDHAFYVSGEHAAQNGRIDHNLIYDTPNGRGVKIGGPSGGGPLIGGVRVDHNTIYDCTGPSAVQVSNGATNCTAEFNVAYRCGTPPFTDGTGSMGGSVYRNNATDVTAGEDTTNFTDGGGNVIRTIAQLSDHSLMASQGYGHLT